MSIAARECCQIVMVQFGLLGQSPQVSVAILLDNFVSSAAQIKREEERSLANEYRRVEEGLNPLLRLILHLAQACFTECLPC
jgi:hypothetical protein